MASANCALLVIMVYMVDAFDHGLGAGPFDNNQAFTTANA